MPRDGKGASEHTEHLLRTFIDADDSLIYLKDSSLCYVFVNKAVERFYGRTAATIIGQDDFAISDAAFAAVRRETDIKVIEQQKLVVGEVNWLDRVYRTRKFPVQMPDGSTGIGAYIRDVTDEYDRERKQARTLQRAQIMASVFARTFESVQEQLDYVLNECLQLTESQFGYIYLYDEDKEQFTLNSWSGGVMAACSVTSPQSVYALIKTGIWGEAVRQRKPVILNDFSSPHPLKKGYPPGHVELKRFMTIPVIIDGRIVAVTGFANKTTDYDEQDIYEMTVLMSGIWNAVKRKEALDALALERNHYLQILTSIGDGVLVVDNDGKVIMLNQVAQELTGWQGSEAIGRHYRDILVIAHEDGETEINDPVAEVLAKDKKYEMDNHVVLTSADGRQYSLEDSAAPIKGNNHQTVGVVLVFRDATEKKAQRKKVEQLSYYDQLTGLYNRHFFEAEMKRLDTARNLPLSVVIGDVNGLKLTNDVFGHAAGDELLQKIACVLTRVCRSDDIISRWGGDEFMLLLPKTSLSEAEQIVQRIKTEFARIQVRSMQGSISMGCAAKTTAEEKLLDVLEDAEEAMYDRKIVERRNLCSTVIQTIQERLFSESRREEAHARRVSKLAVQFGKVLHLKEDELRKLKDAAYLHDIGKISLSPELLMKNYNFTDTEFNEVKKHATVGYRILNAFDDTLDIAESVLAHHEHWDGTGYPKGLAGDEIPRLARIIHLIEGFDRMTRESMSKSAMNEDQALQAIKEEAGAQFDPNLSAAFIEMMGQG
jgi:diguanylate cyclase (GGDEF)-like protein/PAS domain S-box-containing protein